MLILTYASVAQLDRAQDSDSWCRGFKSCQTHHVGAKFALLRRSFIPAEQNAHSLAPPFQTQTAATGLRFGAALCAAFFLSVLTVCSKFESHVLAN